jgi:hypothetical protein
MESNQITEWDKSKWLVISSFSFLPNAYISYTNKLYIQSCLLLWVTFSSINYWRNATFGLRRTTDIVSSNIAFYYFLYSGIIYLNGIGVIICYPNLAAIIYCYHISCKLYEEKNENWLNYHILFHFLVGIQGSIITCYIE